VPKCKIKKCNRKWKQYYLIDPQNNGSYNTLRNTRYPPKLLLFHYQRRTCQMAPRIMRARGENEEEMGEILA
jgi:hypothetical protein